MSSGLSLYCTELCAVCIHSHSVGSCSDSQKNSTVLHSCGSLCKWRFLIMSPVSIRSHAVQNQAFQISLHGDPLPACTSENIVFPLISSNVGIHFLEHCGKHFTDLNQISHSKTANIVQCQRNGSVHTSNFQCWDRL